MKLITSSSIRSSWRRLYATRHPPLAGDLSDEVRKIISTHHYSDILTAEVLNELSNNHECFELVSKIRGAISLQKGPSSNKASVIDPFDKILKEWLSNEVESDAVSTKRIDFKSSNSSLINKIIEGDAVHGSNATSIKELSSRENRRCFGLFHQSLSNDPIAFIHVALTNDIAFSMSSLDISADAKTPSCAIFYSVNSPHPGLKGLDLGAKMIKAATKEVLSEFSGIRTLSTLSPVPGFIRWLNISFSNGKIDSFLMSNRSRLTRDVNHIKRDLFDIARSPRILCGNGVFDDNLKPTLLWLGCQYLALEKKLHSALPLDEVARFHLRNGAVLHRLNWGANNSPQFLDTSAGMMVNYAYQLDPNKFPVSSTTVISTTSTTTDTAGKSIPNTSNYTAQYDLNTRAKYFTENPGRVPLSKDVYDLLFKSKIV